MTWFLTVCRLHVELARDHRIAVTTFEAAQNFQLTGGKTRHREPPPSVFAQKLQPNQPVEYGPEDLWGRRKFIG